MLGNVQSIWNKVDELRASVQYLSDYRQSCLICLSETWLNETDPESAIDLEGFSVVRADRNASSGKSKGGGVCMFINNKYCNPSQTEAKSPDAAKFILGDFNLCSLNELLPTYHQYVSCPTRGEACLDLCYGNIEKAYYAKALPGLGRSDHNMIWLIPAYQPLIRREKVQTREVKCWSADSTAALRGCLDSTDWDVIMDTSDINDAATVYSWPRLRYRPPKVDEQKDFKCNTAQPGCHNCSSGGSSTLGSVSGLLLGALSLGPFGSAGCGLSGSGCLGAGAPGGTACRSSQCGRPQRWRFLNPQCHAMAP
ncbi:hypothetical protein N1851_008046 [Merluccius polli]|uniref:Endonuclease/exonuclease/phosphatase domain-containing protein n=1 Tax=Merluccius polli TaxID=89951 RepID=A0AA47P925_MERPO|nr:hypothetical protein N1851_008046 [Merluccius polli]